MLNQLCKEMYSEAIYMNTLLKKANQTELTKQKTSELVTAIKEINNIINGRSAPKRNLITLINFVIKHTFGLMAGMTIEFGRGGTFKDRSINPALAEAHNFAISINNDARKMKQLIGF